MTGEVDVSEQDNSVSEHEVLVSLSIIKSSVQVVASVIKCSK